MRIWYDGEFSTTAPEIGLISLGAVAEDGREFYGVSTEFDPERAHPWVKANVLPQLPPPGDPAWMTREQLKAGLLEFLGEDPVLWAWYGAYDHVALSQLWEHLGRPPMPKQQSGLHDALADAQHVKVRWEALQEKAYLLGLQV